LKLPLRLAVQKGHALALTMTELRKRLPKCIEGGA
jgi:hypothetical protein